MLSNKGIKQQLTSSLRDLGVQNICSSTPEVDSILATSISMSLVGRVISWVPFLLSEKKRHLSNLCFLSVCSVTFEAFLLIVTISSEGKAQKR